MTKKIIRLSSSPRGEASITRKLGNIMIGKIKEKYPDCLVKERDLAKNSLPHLSEGHINSFFTPSEQRSSQQNNEIRDSDEAIAELLEADILIIEAPMYNFMITSSLKAYFDHIARSGITFRYTENGIPEGLLNNKIAYVITASGGLYSEGAMQAFDFVIPYIRFFLTLIGIPDISFINAEGLNVKGVKEVSFERAVESMEII